MKEIGDREVGEALFELFRENPWLMERKPATVFLLHIVERAEAAIVQFCNGEADNFDSLAPEVRDMAAWMFMAFLHRLRNDGYQGNRWQVPQGLSKPEVAKHVVLLEIARTTFRSKPLN